MTAGRFAGRAVRRRARFRARRARFSRGRRRGRSRRRDRRRCLAHGASRDRRARRPPRRCRSPPPHFIASPPAAMRLIAVTGTNGKTTTVGMLRHLFDTTRRAARASARSACSSEAGAPLAGANGSLTTPGPIELQRTLRALADAGVGTVAMEVSSHSLDQRRPRACSSPPPYSRISRATISTTTARWRRISRRRHRWFRMLAPTASRS